MYHKVLIVGYLGRNPEMRYTPNGQAVTNFSVASTRKWTASDGTPQEETTWVRVIAWGKLGETCNQYLAKGRLVLVEGRLTPDKDTGGPRVWVGNDGVARAQYEITAEGVRFLGGRNGNGNGPREGQPAAEPEPAWGDELPF
jgi:single-strand DNA-binding protein